MQENVKIKAKVIILKYCIKKAQQIIRDEPLPNPEEVVSMQKVFDVFNQMYFNSESENQKN